MGMRPQAGRERTGKYKTRFNACWFGDGYPKATYNSAWQKKNRIYHPTVKNVEFLSWLIQISSQGSLFLMGLWGQEAPLLRLWKRGGAIWARKSGRNILKPHRGGLPEQNKRSPKPQELSLFCDCSGRRCGH